MVARPYSKPLDPPLGAYRRVAIYTSIWTYTCMHSSFKCISITIGSQRASCTQSNCFDLPVYVGYRTLIWDQRCKLAGSKEIPSYLVDKILSSRTNIMYKIYFPKPRKYHTAQRTAHTSLKSGPLGRRFISNYIIYQ